MVQRTPEDTMDIICIVDRSGSMYELAEDASGGLNTYVETQKTAPGETFFTLVQFDTEFDKVYDCTPIDEVKPYKLEPRGSTALYDAIGQTIGGWTRNNPTIVVICTDGAENSSHEWNHSRVKELMDQKRADGWGFTFLTSDETAFEDGVQMVGAQNTYSYAATPTGMRTAYNLASSTTASYRTTVSSDDPDWVSR